MAALQKLNQYVTDLETEVADLEKREAAARQNCTTLEAREKFLRREVKELEDKRKAAVRAQEEAATKATEDKTAAEQVVTDIRKAGEQLRSEEATKLSDLSKKTEAATKELEETQTQIKEARKLLLSFQDEKTVLLDDIEQLEKEKAAETAKLTSITSEVETARTIADEDIAGFAGAVKTAEAKLTSVNTQVAEAETTLEDVNQAVEAAKKKLVEAAKKHDDFVDYEARAKKALKTHEKSLIEKERRLDVQIVTSRRRSSILDNVE